MSKLTRNGYTTIISCHDLIELWRTSKTIARMKNVLVAWIERVCSGVVIHFSLKELDFAFIAKEYSNVKITFGM